jgi:hypothetical protein
MGNCTPDLNTDEFGTCLFEVSVKNRVVKRGTGLPITGQQGKWYDEKILVIGENEDEIKKLVHQNIESRRILGKQIFKEIKYTREIKITSVKRIA